MTVKQVTSRILLINGLFIVFSIALGLFKTGNPSRYFGEGRFTTLFSCLQLLAVAWFSWQTFLVRRKIAPGMSFVSAASLWALIAAGFVFLAADEAFEFHEHLDKFMHKALHISPTSLSDRLDDILVAAYAVIGLIVLWLFRRELWTFKQILRPMGGGFACLFISVFCDVMSNDDEYIKKFTDNPVLTKQLGAWLAVGDGAFTLLGEGFFLAAFYLLYRTVTRPNQLSGEWEPAGADATGG